MIGAPKVEMSGLLTEWKVCGGIAGMPPQRLNAPLLGNPSCNNPQDIQAKGTNKEGFHAPMVEEILNEIHGGVCLFPEPSKGIYSVVVEVAGLLAAREVLSHLSTLHII